MSAWTYVGPEPSATTDLVDLDYITTAVAATNVQQATIDQTIANGLSPYCDKSYVDQQNALNATQAFVDAGDATRLHISQLGINSGIAPLNAYGRVDKSRVPLGSTQRWPAPYYSPSAYQSGPVTLGSSETSLYSYAQPDPGFAYRLLVQGLLEGRTVTDGTPIQAIIRLASPTGIAIATGYSTSEAYVGGVLYPFTTPGNFSFQIPSFAASIDMLILGSGAGGASGSIFGNGSGGGAGQLTAASVVVGSAQLPSNVTQINGMVAVGGAGDPGGQYSNPGSPGNPSSVTYYQTTQTATGGAPVSGINKPPVAPPASYAYNGFTYTTTGYGTGGVGGVQGSTALPGLQGQNGAVWLLVHPKGGDSNYSGIPVLPLSLALQPVLTGAQTLYARFAGPQNSIITANYPGLHVTPIPA